jgi:hypothetical protein
MTVARQRDRTAAFVVAAQQRRPSASDRAPLDLAAARHGGELTRITETRIAEMRQPAEYSREN